MTRLRVSLMPEGATYERATAMETVPPYVGRQQSYGRTPSIRRGFSASGVSTTKAGQED